MFSGLRIFIFFNTNKNQNQLNQKETIKSGALSHLIIGFPPQKLSTRRTRYITSVELNWKWKWRRFVSWWCEEYRVKKKKQPAKNSGFQDLKKYAYLKPFLKSSWRSWEWILAKSKFFVRAVFSKKWWRHNDVTWSDFDDIFR